VYRGFITNASATSFADQGCSANISKDSSIGPEIEKFEVVPLAAKLIDAGINRSCLGSGCLTSGPSDTAT
jgi:hypothetical protein